MNEPDVRFDDPRECPQLNWDGTCFDGYTAKQCPHCFANRLKCEGNRNRKKGESAK